MIQVRIYPYLQLNLISTGRAFTKQDERFCHHHAAYVRQEIEHFCLWPAHNSCTATCRHLCKAPRWISSLKSGGQGQCPWERPTAHNSGLIGQAILCVWLIMPVQCKVKHNGVWQPPDSNGLQKMKSMWLCGDGLLELPLSGLSSIQLLIPRGKCWPVNSARLTD